jgi:hypothetical protein
VVGDVHLQNSLNKNASQVNLKSMLVIFFDWEGIVHQELVPPGQTVNQHYYQEVLQNLRELQSCPPPIQSDVVNKSRLTCLRYQGYIFPFISGTFKKC